MGRKQKTPVKVLKNCVLNWVEKAAIKDAVQGNNLR
jgi:hypothetical protein